MAKGIKRKMERRRREALAEVAAIGAEDEQEEEEPEKELAPLRPKTKQKKQEEAEPEEEAEQDEEALAEAARRSTRRKRKREAQEAVEEAVEEAATARPKKQKKQRREAVAEEAVEDEDVEPDNPKTHNNNKQGRENAAEEDESKEAIPKEGAEEGVAAEGEEFTVFVGGVPWSVDDATLREDFEECGEVVAVNLPKHSDSGLSRGIAFVTYKDRAGLDAALKFDGTDYWGRQLQVYRAENRGSKGGKDGKGQADKFEVFLKNLPAETEEAALRKFFLDCGKILRLNIGLHEDGRCKGFAWITFQTKTALGKALAYNGEEYGGKTLVVEKSGLHVQAGGGGEKGGGKKGKSKGNPEQEVFVRNLTYETMEADVRKHFEASCGAIERMHMPVAPGKSRGCMGFAFMTFETMEGFTKAMEMNGEQYDGRTLEVQKSGEKKDDKGKGKSKGGGKGKGKK